MKTEPRDLDRDGLAALLERHWGLAAVELEYLPVGFGSHHWRATDSGGTRRFVTADDLTAGFQHGPDTDSAFAALDRAFSTAAALREDAGLEFVLAPLRDREGAVLRRLSDRYAVNVSPFAEGTAGRSGAYESPDDRRRMGTVLGRLHEATGNVPPELPRREDFVLPARRALVEALADLDPPWSSGPFAEPARGLLRASAPEIQQRFREYDELVASLRDTAASWVLTHGEPHSANVIRSPGGLLLVDWDTTLVAPRERDLRMVMDAESTGLAEYRAVAGSVSLDEEALRLYGLWWELADVGLFTKVFRDPHERTEDTAKAWTALTSYLPF